MFKANFLNRIKGLVARVAKPTSRQDYIDKWKHDLETGRHLEFTTGTEGYKAAVDHFEVIVNSLLREGNKLEQVQGIEMVFQYLESGKLLAQSSAEQLRKFEDQE